MTRPLSGGYGATRAKRTESAKGSHGVPRPAPGYHPGLTPNGCARAEWKVQARALAVGSHGVLTYLRTSSSISSFFLGLIVSSLSLRYTGPILWEYPQFCSEEGTVEGRVSRI